MNKKLIFFQEQKKSKNKPFIQQKKIIFLKKLELRLNNLLIVHPYTPFKSTELTLSDQT